MTPRRLRHITSTAFDACVLVAFVTVWTLVYCLLSAPARASETATGTDGTGLFAVAAILFIAVMFVGFGVWMLVVVAYPRRAADPHAQPHGDVAQFQGGRL